MFSRGGGRIIDSSFFLKTATNRWCKSYLRFKSILFGQTMGIEAGFKFVRPCPYLPDYITSAKRVLNLLMWWDWIPCIVCSDIICNFEKQRKMPTPPAKT